MYFGLYTTSRIITNHISGLVQVSMGVYGVNLGLGRIDWSYGITPRMDCWLRTIMEI